MDADRAVEVVSDGDGLVFLGDTRDVENLLRAWGLLEDSERIEDLQLGTALGLAAGAVKAGAEAIAEGGRWVKLTPESARAAEAMGFMESKIPGVRHAMIGRPGDIEQWVQIEQGTLTNLTNPAYLAGIAGVLAQVAKHQEMKAIKDYLARIDAKVDELLRAHRDDRLARVIGAGFDIRSAVGVLEDVGRVDDDTWSTVQGHYGTLSHALSSVVLRLDSIAAQQEDVKLKKLARTAAQAESEVAELLAIAARCFELQDALDILRLERAAQESLEDLSALRRSLAEDRKEHRDELLTAIDGMLARLHEVGVKADANTVLRVRTSRAVVASVNAVGDAVDGFRAPLGLDPTHRAISSTPWRDSLRNPQHLETAAEEVRRRAKMVTPPPATVAYRLLEQRRRRRNEDG